MLFCTWSEDVWASFLGHSLFEGVHKAGFARYGVRQVLLPHLWQVLCLVLWGGHLRLLLHKPNRESL